MDVSVIIPVYNVEKYLDECIESVINQDIDIQYEIICINDGSTDHSLEILKKYSRDTDKLKIINQANKGLSAARNKGLKEAKGRYIMFIDSDDYLIDNKALIKLYEEIHSNNLDFVVGDFTYVFEDANKNYKISRSNEIKNKIMTGKEMYDNGIKSRSIMSVVWNKMYRRDFLIQNNLEFVEGIVYEDMEFTPKAYYLAKKVKFIDSNIYAYRQRENSIMSSKKQIRIDDYLCILNSIGLFNVKYKSKELKLLQQYISKLIVDDLNYISNKNTQIRYINEIKNNKNFIMLGEIKNIKYTIYILLMMIKVKSKLFLSKLNIL